jgi:hypothetical protein
VAFGGVVAVWLASMLLGSASGTAATKPALGRACKVSQIGTVSGSLVCTKSGKSAVWRRSPATTTTVLDIAKAPPGTVLYSENFDDPAKSTWNRQSGEGWSAETKDGQFRLAAAPPAPGRLGVGPLLTAAGRVEVAFDMTLTPGALSKASVNLACQDTGAATAPLNFLLIDIRTDGRIVALRYDNAAATQQPTQFFDLGFTNQNRFDPALIHPRTRVALRCIRDGQNVQVALSLDGKLVMETTTPALGGVGDGFTLYLSTFSTGFRDPAELLIDNIAITKV